MTFPWSSAVKTPNFKKNSNTNQQQNKLSRTKPGRKKSIKRFMQPIYKQLKECGYPANYSACLILDIAAVVSVEQRGADAAAEIQPHTSNPQFWGNSKVVPAFPKVFMRKGIKTSKQHNPFVHYRQGK